MSNPNETYSPKLDFDDICISLYVASPQVKYYHTAQVYCERMVRNKEREIKNSEANMFLPNVCKPRYTRQLIKFEENTEMQFIDLSQLMNRLK